MGTYLGLDIGTSSVKAILLDERQTSLAEASAPLTVSRPRPLWSEQDPGDWWSATLSAIAAIRAAAPEAWRGLAAIGLSGQMHGATLLDDAGRVLRPAILWNDGRSGAECAELHRRLPNLATRASQIAMPGFTAPKLLWVARHEPEIFAKIDKVLLPKDYIRWRLSGAMVSDMSDASGTLWLDIAARAWDATLLAATDLPPSAMPALVEGSAVSATLSASLAAEWGLAGRDILIAGGGGDNAASAVGIGAVRAGEGFISVGTSGVVFAVTDRLAAAPERTLHAFCHALPGRWHGMSVHLSAAASLDWVARLTGRSGAVATLVADAGTFAQSPERRRHAPIFLPYLSGERTPHNDPLATGLFAGLTHEHDAAALAYAVLEGVAFAFADGTGVMESVGAKPTRCLLVGGGARSAFWGQLIADATGLDLEIPAGAESGAAFGAARLAMLAAEAGAEAEVCATPAIRERLPSRASDLLVARLDRFRRLYRAERSTRG